MARPVRGAVAGDAFGAFLGLPILGIRGDYLAIATLGFGEIIRILAGSDLLKPLLGGPRGIINIPKPIEVAADSFLAGPDPDLLHRARLRGRSSRSSRCGCAPSRLGRAWVAIREDEDVAEALGVNLVQTKLLAYMLGRRVRRPRRRDLRRPRRLDLRRAASTCSSRSTWPRSSSSAAWAASRASSSARIFLIGLPELFREFSDYRFLFYGVALIGMMLYRPEGLLPSRIVRRELHVERRRSPRRPPTAGDTAPDRPRRRRCR